MFVRMIRISASLESQKIEYNICQTSKRTTKFKMFFITYYIFLFFGCICGQQMLHNDEYDDNIFDKYDTSTWTTTNNPTHYNIGAILSDRQHVLTFVNEIELANNSLSPSKLKGF